MTASSIEFETAFASLTGHSPLGWQRRLFDQLRAGQIPGVCDLPTGLGKTSVIPIWMIALAWQAQERPVSLPRRLVYIVNRRTVVDQATTLVEQIRQRLLAPDDARWRMHQEGLRTLARALQSLSSAGDAFLAVSTLRGELADNQEWKADPARPAIIIGTIDMIGSKLLFSGYGDGRYWRAQHAGLMGQDSLIVHDEAHLTPAFSDLLHYLADIQCQDGEPRPVRVMELSATSRGGDGLILKLEPQDEEDEVVRHRLDATKCIRLAQLKVHREDTPAKANEKTAQKLVELSLEHKDAQSRILIYVRTPETAQKILKSLRGHLVNENGEERIALLTGTIRGHERDNLIRTGFVYRAFLHPEIHIDQTLYLVSTSAGEVGIDIDADHMVCDLSTLDSMIQRLGRVNRRGGPEREAQVDVVVLTEGQDSRKNLSEFDEAIRSTQTILGQWAATSDGYLNLSPRGLRRLLDGLDPERKEKAFAPKPPVRPLTDILLDAWSLTSVTKRMPGRPDVAPYLHGLEETLPETYVVWRKEVILLSKAEVDPDTLSDWFEACPIESRERLRDRTDHVEKSLGALLKAHREKDEGEGRDFPIVLLDEYGEAVWSRLSSVVAKDLDLRYRTVVLPVEAGGLDEDGALDHQHVGEATDVAEYLEQAGAESPHVVGQGRARWLLTEEVDGLRYRRLLTDEEALALPQDWKERERVTLKPPPEEVPQGGRYLLLTLEPTRSALEQVETAKTSQALDFHRSLTADRMSEISEALGLDKELRDALALAAQWHDLGKNRPIWQHYACNPPPAAPLAKSFRYLHNRTLGGYRHEFGSLLEAAAHVELRKQDEADIILHLIASHHGWARPHFDMTAWDNSHTTARNEEAATEVMRRFARLQKRFGRRGLAWLESLMRCADIAASLRSAESASKARQEVEA